MTSSSEDVDVELARITVRRVLTPDGMDLVRIEQDNGNGELLPVIEALGLLQIAVHDVLNPPTEEN